MANIITVAQIITLKAFVDSFKVTEEIKIAHRYSSGNIVLYLPDLTVDIFPNGNWRTRSPRTGEKLADGKFTE